MRQLLAYAVCGGFLLLGGGITHAQDFPPEGPPPPPVGMETVGPLGGPDAAFRVELLGFEGMLGAKSVVTGAPFSAVGVTETIHALADGNRITRKTETTVYRDSQGRFRREVHLAGIGPLHTSGKQRSFIVIQDPVAGTAYILNPEEKTANKVAFPAAKILAAGKQTATGLEVRLKKKMAEENWQKESLGTQTISGVNAEGTRQTRTIPAGEIGNEKPITIISEQWYSPDLQWMVMSKRNDPMFGETTYTLTNIRRQEPDASLFTVPPDYTVKEGEPPMMRRALPGQVPVAPKN